VLISDMQVVVWMFRTEDGCLQTSWWVSAYSLSDFSERLSATR